MSGLVGLRFEATCMEEGCDWHYDGERADREAEKHTKAATHATRSWATPIEQEQDRDK